MTPTTPGRNGGEGRGSEGQGGTVEMGTTRDAAKAIQLLNDSDFKGGRLDVRPDAFA